MKTWIEGLVVRFTVQFCRSGLETFFRSIQIEGQSKLPEGALIAAANHPNMLLDPFLVSYAFLPRRLHFLAKAPLFQIPLLGWLFRVLGALPVYRRQDSPSDMGKNEDMFRDCIEALHQGAGIGIFPEGVSANEPTLQPLKTGAARILLQSQDLAPETPMFLVPIGLNYEDRATFWVGVFVRIGDPIPVQDFLKAYREDPRAAARGLTDHLESCLRELTLDLEFDEDERWIERLEKVFREDLGAGGKSPRGRYLLARNLVRGFRFHRQRDPERVAEVQARLHRYVECLERFAGTGSHLDLGPEGYRLSRVLWFLLGALPKLVFPAPVALYGALFNLLPYQLTDPLAKWAGDGAAELGTHKLLGGTVVFFLLYLLQGILVGLWLGPLWALAFVSSLPPTGILTLWWLEEFRTFWSHLKTFGIFVTRTSFRDRLAQLREQLLEDLEGLVRDYEAETESDEENP